MSLILDALRKSEAERQRGRAPDLFSATSPALPRSYRRHVGVWPWLLMGALVLSALIWVMWPTPSMLVVSHPSVALTPAATSPAATSPVATTPVIVANDIGATTEHQSAPVASTFPAKTRPSVTSAPRPFLTNIGTDSPAPTNFGDNLTAAMAASTNVTSDADEETLPSMATLASNERSALPPLKLSMHVWNPSPDKRFAIIDGQRVTEGASLSGAVVAQIRRDGVVLDVNGHRVLLPRP